MKPLKLFNRHDNALLDNKFVNSHKMVRMVDELTKITKWVRIFQINCEVFENFSRYDGSRSISQVNEFIH